MPGPYELYLVRHGVAEERGPKWPDDGKRPLSADGMSRLKKSARGLDRLDVKFDVILTSPLVRARQTADILSAEMDGHPTIVNVDSLTPGGTFAALVSDLEKHTRKTRIALVGPLSKDDRYGYGAAARIRAPRRPERNPVARRGADSCRRGCRCGPCRRRRRR